MKNLAKTIVVALVMCLVSGHTCVEATPINEIGLSLLDNMYGMSVSNTNVYQIDPVAGTVTVVSSTALFGSSGIGFDGMDLYYWEWPGTGGVQGLAKWNPGSGTHTLINSSDSQEDNAASGSLLVVGKDTDDLYSVNKGTGARTKIDDISGNTLQFQFGDISSSPDGKLYISTDNINMGYDTKNNYVWDPDTSVLTKFDGPKYTGLAWYSGKLYAARNINGTGTVFELNPTDFSEVSQVAAATEGVLLNDLGALVPEPATLAFLLVTGSLGLIIRRQRP